jgi:GT2 family glycosyltransferase
MCGTWETMSTPEISAVIVSWNAKHYLMDCLRSLYESTPGMNLEIIVVDNASTDGSPEAVEKVYPEVILIKNETNRGFAAANNIGIKQSKGRYVCLINSDIKVLENCLAQLRDYMDTELSIGMLGPKILNADMSLQSSCRSYPSLWNNFCTATALSRLFKETKFFSGEHMLFFKHDEVRLVDVLVGCFLMARRDALNQVGLLDERFFIYSEDIDWCRRFWRAGWEVVFYPQAQAIHYRGGSSVNEPSRFAIEQNRAVLQYWKKYHEIPEQFAILSILALKHFLRIGASFISLIIQSSNNNNNNNIENIKKHISCLNALLRLKSLTN